VSLALAGSSGSGSLRSRFGEDFECTSDWYPRSDCSLDVRKRTLPALSLSANIPAIAASAGVVV